VRGSGFGGLLGADDEVAYVGMRCGQRVLCGLKWSRPAVVSPGETVHDLADRCTRLGQGEEVVLLPNVVSFGSV
jgi:hypothetical protein